MATSQKKRARKAARRRRRQRRRLLIRGAVLLAGFSLLVPLFLPRLTGLGQGTGSGASGAVAFPPSVPEAGHARHDHALLEVLIDGEPVAVPALERGRFVDIHLDPYTLGQALSDRGILLDPERGCLNQSCAGQGGKLEVQVNGQAVADPAAYELQNGDRVRVILETGARGDS